MVSPSHRRRAGRSTWGPSPLEPAYKPSFRTTQPPATDPPTSCQTQQSARLYISGPITDRSSSCSTPSTTAPPTRSACWTRWRRFAIVSQVQHLGRAASCRRATAPTCTARSTPIEWARIHRRHSGRLSVRLPGPRQRRRCTGASSARSEGLGGRVRRRAGDRQSPKVLGAARVQIDFWDPEDGYYLNGTYYGDKNLLAIGGATQMQGGNTATTVDFLLEKKTAQRRRRSRSKASTPTTTGWADTTPATPRARAPMGWQAISSRRRSASGKFEILGKYAKADFTHGATSPATTRRPPKSISTTSSSSSTRA